MITGKKRQNIAGFEHYEVTENGKVNILASYLPEYGYIASLSKRIDRAGYFTVRISSKGNTYSKYIHRLIAEAFILNPENKPFVNHRDGNKLNNAISNLEWVDHATNINHAYQSGLIKSKARPVIDACSGVIYKSTRDASQYLGLNHSTLKNYLNGNRRNSTNLKYVEGKV